MFGSFDVEGLTARLATILDVVGDGVIAIDERQVIRKVNREVERIERLQKTLQEERDYLRDEVSHADNTGTSSEKAQP